MPILPTFSDSLENMSLETVSVSPGQSAWNEDAERFASTFRYAATGMALVSRGGLFLKANPAFTELIGYSEAELRTADFQSLTHPDDLEADLAFMHQLLDGIIDSCRFEKRYIHKAGHTVWVLLSSSLIRDSHGKALYFISQVQDLSAQKKAEAKLLQSEQKLNDATHELELANQALEKVAHHDALTGLRNRRSFEERLKEEVARSRRTKVGFSLVLLDVDNFKKVNENHGHATGDEVLVQLSRLLEKTLRCVDIISRYEGEGFALILPSTLALGGYRAAERCLDAIANYPWNHGSVSASCGVATWEDEDEQTLLVRADVALHRAKEAGGDKVFHSQFETGK
jgi:diguanylate cyclase (GGDEF)-like protein/PAS domain S-box-containing protein